MFESSIIMPCNYTGEFDLEYSKYIFFILLYKKKQNTHTHSYHTVRTVKINNRPRAKLFSTARPLLTFIHHEVRIYVPVKSINGDL